jgi:hypothetical protein
MSDSCQSPAIPEMPLGMQLLAGGAVGFTLENIPEHERLPVFREVFGRAVLKYDLEPLPDIPFDIDLKFQALPGLMMMSGRAHGSRNRRTLETLGARILSLTVAKSSCWAMVKPRWSLWARCAALPTARRATFWPCAFPAISSLPW